MCQRRQKSWSDTAAYGESKFCGKLEAEQERHADRDVGVAAEVGVDLDGVAVDGDQHLERRVLVRRREHSVDDVRRQVVGDHHLLEEAGDDQEERAATSFTCAGSRGALELRQQLAGARTIGPATRCGKNDRNTAKSRERGGHQRRRDTRR